ncbi:hypothetical protein N2152v2_005165 [Parachlorella kessleri]
MADLAAFGDPKFDPKAFINKACAERTGDEPIERFLAELEMKLHLTAEDTSLYLQDHSSRAVTRIPAATKELLRIKDNVQALRGDAGAALRQLEEAEGGAASAVATLRDLDRVKQRMEAACTTLKEATGLSSLFQRVDSLFDSGDPARVAAALAGMRRGLAVVGDSVQEFRGGRERLARLEERFATMVEGSLATALAAKDGAQVQSLAAMLASTGKQEVVVRLYSSMRVAPLQALWDSYTPATPFVAWLAAFYEQALAALGAEADWCQATLPDSFPGLLLALLSGFLGRVDKPYRQRLAGALAAGAGTSAPLEVLQQAQSAALKFAGGLYHLLTTAVAGGDASTQQAWQPASDFPPLLSKILAPVEDAVKRYADLEQQYLSTELQQLAAKAVHGSAAAPLETLPPQLTSAVPPAASVLGEALSRCAALTAGTALPALARVLDRSLQQFVMSLQGAVLGLRARALGDSKEAPNDDSGESSEALLPLLLLADMLRQRLAVLEAALRSAAANAAQQLLAQAGPGQVYDATAAARQRLEAQPPLRQALASLAAVGPGSPLLALSTGAVGEAAGVAEGVVFDVLLGRVRAQLQVVPTLSEWQTKQSGLPLPSFTPYPLQYITSVGEYLMMLPQLLESALLGEDEEDEAAAAQLVADWIDKVTLGAAAAYQEQLQRLAGLSPQGAAQLAADLEYFANVLTTLGVTVPPTLAAWQLAAGAAPDSLHEVFAAASGDGGNRDAKAAVERVAQLRGLLQQQ